MIANILYVLTFIVSILVTILFVIGTHEFAHFIVARLLGVRVLRFSIGFGKTLWRRIDKSGIEYVVALVPLGGYVKMLDENEDNVPPAELHRAFNRQPFYKKFLIVLAGPTMNLLCAVALYWLIFVVGFVTIKPVISQVTPHSIAYQAGLKANQEIVSVDQKPIKSWTGVMFRLLVHLGNQSQLTVGARTRNNQLSEHTLDVRDWKLDELTPDPLSSLGITPVMKLSPDMLREVKYSPINAITPAFREVVQFSYFNLVLFGKLVTGKLSLKTLGGPIAIFETAGKSLNSGIVPFLGFLAFMSASVGIINLFPIPGLDGGHLLFEVIEVAIRRPIPQGLLAGLYYAGFGLLIFVLGQALVNDVLRLV